MYLISNLLYLLGWEVWVRGSGGGGGWVRILEWSSTTSKSSISIIGSHSRTNIPGRNCLGRSSGDPRSPYRFLWALRTENPAPRKARASKKRAWEGPWGEVNDTVWEKVDTVNTSSEWLHSHMYCESLFQISNLQGKRKGQLNHSSLTQHIS